MNVTQLHDFTELRDGSLEAALAAFDSAGIEYDIVCEGPEPACPEGTPAAA